VKLVIAVVDGRDARRLGAELAARGLRSTRLASTGGFLRDGNTTLLVGVDDAKVEEVLAVVRRVCHPRRHLLVPLAYLAEGSDVASIQPVEVTAGGATVFVLNAAGAATPRHDLATDAAAP
jgi:uncharacterized protein YaaQ